MAESDHCSIPSCNQPAVTSLDARRLCRQHFIAACNKELEAYSLRLRERRLGDVSLDGAWRFIRECMRQADTIEQTAKGLESHEREELLDLILGAVELGLHLRRSPRRTASVPIRVFSEKPWLPWEEETETQLISRYGAMVEFRHPVERGDQLLVARTDTGQQARARVAWSKPKQEGQIQVGIEFEDCDNFWELDWSA